MPEPLHPAVVHFPIVFAFLSPVAAMITLWAIRSGRLTTRAWLGVLVLQAAVLTSGWIAEEQGEHEEERVERVIDEEPIEEHEEAAERFMLMAGLTFALAAAGMLGNPLGAVARGLTVAVSIATVVAVAAVGQSGGELVYRHGAARTYTQPDATNADGVRIGLVDDHEDDHEDDDD
ncbi:MAG: hypothetical protein JRG80_21335 [Deltaproteobacteria bacterium]|nr:hypothetical protein [Deltaproteobacteria bacterium]MBW2401764.1 hypothetical protein [Deltaproteobacteria bacterium]MBW2668131.1 hypothetical protein [Deltaproteobacteria bacterium]